MIRKHSCTAGGSASRRADDFSLIQGIGPAIDARLHGAGIRTFAQLAACSPESIAAIVTVRSAKGIVKENWIGQARKLASKAASVGHTASQTISDTRQQYATFTVELLLNEDNNVRRTRVRQVQTEVEETWAGWQDTRLMDFFIRRAGLRVTRPEPALLLEPVSPPPPAHHAQTTVWPSDQEIETGLSGVLRVCSLAILPLGSEVPRNSVHAGEGFNVRLVLDLKGVLTAKNTPLSYAVTIWAKNLREMSRQIAGEGRGTFMRADTVQCSAKVEISSPGIYRLEALVTLAEQGKESLPQHTLMAMQTSMPLQVF